MTTNPTATTLDITPSPRILSVIAEVDLALYQCLAELVDNSLDELARAAAVDESIERRVDIQLPRASEATRSSVISVSDNGRGMSVERLQQSMRAGSSGNSMYGSLGLFGMGFNIATARLGKEATVKTGRVGEDWWQIATINLRELMDTGSFSIPLRREPKGPNEHGTSILVTELGQDTVDNLRKPSAIPNVNKALGKIYTYMLRSPENETFSGREVLGGLGLSLHLNGREVRPLVPCIWDPKRSVVYKGQEINAVQRIKTTLRPAKACMVCGNWESETHASCSQCDSSKLALRDREISGWVGIQRYDHASDFGISLFRQGRCIVHNDQELFDFVNDIGDREQEYPAELGRGRIVGEIHLDHVPVNIRKTDFDRSHRSWQYMREIVRGLGPLKERRAKELNFDLNMSPLGRLFHAYRRYEAGYRYLVPGNGEKALAQAARDWALEFHKGLPEYQTDEKWYAAVVQHADIEAGRDNSIADGAHGNAWLADEGLGDLGMETDTEEKIRPERLDVETPSEVVQETINEMIARYIANSTAIPGLDKPVSLGSGETHLTAYVTAGISLSLNNVDTGFFIHMKAGKIAVFVQRDHELVNKYGWSHAQIALLGLSQYLPDPSRSADNAHEVLMRLIRQFPDLMLTPAAVRSRAGDLLEDIRAAAARLTKAAPDRFWRGMEPRARQAVQYAALQTNPGLNIDVLLKTGDFGEYIVPEAVVSLLDTHPEALLDGAMFKANFAAFTDDRAKSLILGRLRALLLDLDRALDLPPSMPGRELSRLEQSISILSDEIIGAV